MSILYLLIPLSLVLLALAVWAFFWAVDNKQFDDLEGPAYSILFDDDDPRHTGQARTRPQQTASAEAKSTETKSDETKETLGVDSSTPSPSQPTEMSESSHKRPRP